LNLQGVSFVRVKDGKIVYIGNYYDQVVNHMAELRKSQHQRSNSARR